MLIAPSKVPGLNGNPCPRSCRHRSPSTSLSLATSNMDSLMSKPYSKLQKQPLLLAVMCMATGAGQQCFGSTLCMSSRQSQAIHAQVLAKKQLELLICTCCWQVLYRTLTTHVWPCLVRLSPLSPEPQPKSSSSLGTSSWGSANSSSARSVRVSCSFDHLTSLDA